MIELPAKYDELTQEEKKIVRRKYIELQDDLCYHCKASLFGPPAPLMRYMKLTLSLFPEGFFNRPVHLHHDHKTGLTVGAVHCICNAVLWEYHGE